MGLFTGIGDFFRGAFGEDDEEKKRRKAREAAEAAARRQAAQQKPAPQNPNRQSQTQTVQQLFGQKPNSADPLGIIKPQVTPPLLQQQKPPAPKPQAPKPKPAPLPDQEFKTIETVGKEDKKLFGLNMRPVLGDTFGQVSKVEVKNNYKTNKDKFVAQWDGLDDERKKIYLQQVEKLAKNGDQAAINSLRELQQAGRTKGNIMDFIEGSNDKLYGGLTRAGARTIELLPGEQGTGKWADRDAEANRAVTDWGRRGETFGSVQKGVVDIATIVLPVTKIDKLAKANSVIRAMEDGSKIMNIGGKIIRVVPGSLAGTAIDDLQVRGRGDESNLAKSAATGLGTDLAIEALPGVTKYGAKGIKKLFGRGGDALAEEAAGVSLKGGSDLLDVIAREESPDVIQQALGVERSVAEQIAGETNPDVIKETLNRLSVDPNFKMDDELRKRLEEEGITNVKLDPNNPYAASIQGDTITARSQGDLDANINHEIGHSIWKKKLTPEERALFTGQGNASKQAAGRQGYTADDILSEDFSDYMNKALKGQLDQIPDAVRPVIAKYAKVAFDTKAATGDAVGAAVKEETANVQRYIDENPGLTPEQIEAVRTAARKRTAQLTDELEAGTRAAGEAVAAQGDEVAAAAAKRAETNAEVVAEQAARTAPAPGSVVEGTPTTSPEVAANDAYGAVRPTTEEILFDTSKTVPTREGLSLPQRLSPDRLIRENITRPIEEKVNQAVGALQTSWSKPGRGLGRLFTGFSREAGVDAAGQTAKMELRGGVETGKLYRESIADLSKGMDTSSTDRVWATLDPEHAVRKGFDPANIKLNEQEQALQTKLKNIIDNTTEENLRRGLITPEQAANGSYLKRSYSVYDGNTEADKFERGFRTELMSQFRGRKEVSDEMIAEAITDPTYLVGKKAAESHAVWAMQDYGNYLVKSGTVSDVAKDGYTQLPDTAVFGDARGKWVPRNLAEDFTGFQYNNAMTTAFNDLITAYDRLGIRQAKKQLLTIFNPAVRLGNQVSNRLIFSQLNGINPLQFNAEFIRVGKAMKNNDPIYREAVERGLTGIDVSQADFFANRINAADREGKNLAKQALDYVKTSYSGADDQARVAAYSVYRKRGYDPEEAARLVQRGYQDYKSVGFFYDMAAKTPVIGNAFVRFAADSVRIAKNAAVDHPLRTLSTVAAWSAFTNGMSVLSGESELKGDNVLEQGVNLATGASKSEAQKEREGRFGAPKIPFTDISSTVQTPWGEVNAARFMPWYQLNDIGDSPVSKFLPIQQSPVKVKDGKVVVDPAGFQDPLLGQVPQLAMDRDFRNKSIQDPEMNPDRPDQLRNDPLSDEEKKGNVLRWLFTNNAPLGKEIDQTVSAYNGEEDLYGKVRSPGQAWMRNFGVKVEQQGEAEREKRQGMEQYLAETEQIEREMDGMSPEAQEAYKRLTGYYKMRDEVDNEFSPGDKRKVKAEVYNFGEDKWKEYAAHPELYDLMVRKKQREAAKDGKPIQPEFDERLSEGFRRQLIQNKMVAPGDDAELDQRMYASPEYDYYQELKDQYRAKAKQYYPERGEEVIDDETVKHQDAEFPKKPDILKVYGAQYAMYADGKTPNKPVFTDAIKAAKQAYTKQTFDWTNKERAARGLPGITWEMWNNPTFGYDETPSGAGFGFGGGGTPDPYANFMGELTSFSNDVTRYKPIEAQAMPDVQRLFAALQAGKGGGKAKPKLGASASGR